MKLNERLKKVLDNSGLSNPKLEEKTGIKRENWSALRNGRTRVNEDHIEAINNLWPEYAFWITTGNTIPEAGQISPELEEQRQKLRKAG